MKGQFWFPGTGFHVNPEANFLCYFDISSIFSNIPREDTIQACAGTLYNQKLAPPTILNAFFIELLTAAALSVEFSFNSTM